MAAVDATQSGSVAEKIRAGDIDVAFFDGVAQGIERIAGFFEHLSSAPQFGDSIAYANPMADGALRSGI